MEHLFRYDVFLSFRGVDTRNNFTSHLYDALIRHNFQVFHDTILSRGQRIGPQLSEAINESKIFVVVFSTRYADSKWCLDELSQMLHCMHMNHQQTLLPIFLYLKQSHVDVGTQHYQMYNKELITNIGTKFDQGTLHKWREALQEAGELPGLHLEDDANGDEHELLDQIVEKIRNMLHEQPDRPHHVGVESRVQQVMLLLNQDFDDDDDDDDDVRVVVICGPAGIGKTVIAKATYERLAMHFKARHSYFLSDVKTIFGEANGKVTLQKKLLSNLVQNDESRIHIGSYHQGIGKIEKMIKDQKLFLVLDDVDNDQQLKILGLSRAILGRGSRIIVTTRDESNNAVDRVKPDATYKPQLLDEDESLKMFCWNAFGQGHPKEGYEDVSREAACWGAGLPGLVKDLAVHMGSYQSVKEWICFLRYVKQNPSCITDRTCL